MAVDVEEYVVHQVAFEVASAFEFVQAYSVLAVEHDSLPFAVS